MTPFKAAAPEVGEYEGLSEDQKGFAMSAGSEMTLIRRVAMSGGITTVERPRLKAAAIRSARLLLQLAESL